MSTPIALAEIDQVIIPSDPAALQTFNQDLAKQLLSEATEFDAAAQYWAEVGHNSYARYCRIAAEKKRAEAKDLLTSVPEFSDCE